MTSPQTLLSGESVILSSEDNQLILTNYRVKYEVIASSSSIYKSIPVHKISACVFNTRSYPILIALAAIALLIVFLAPEMNQRVGAGIAAAILAALYFGMRNGQIEVFSDSGESIAVPTKGLSHAQVKKFLEAVANQSQLGTARLWNAPS